MNVVATSLLVEFYLRHPQVRKRLEAWLDEMKAAQWKTPNELKQHHATASVLKGGRVVFNINPGAHRLLCRIDYQRQKILILRIGTHKEYDQWDIDQIN